MKIGIIASATLLGLSLTNQVALAQETTSITYKNARNSTLVLNFTDKDHVTGSFTTAVATKDCQQAIGAPRPVIGYILGNSITLSVDYPDCGSVVSFSGNLNADKSQIETIAIVTHQSSGTFGSQFISNDIFKQEKKG